MLFNSFSFLIFFPVVTLTYFIIPKKLKNFWLLLASYFFYMWWDAKFAVLILFSTVTTFLCSIAIDKAKTALGRKLSLIVSIVLNLAVLFLFKYYDFFAVSLTELFSCLNIPLNVQTFSLVLPVGISFYTFQALGYAIDVYRKDIKREKNFFTYALFVSFFPQLVAGPVERSKNLLPQFNKVYTFKYNRVKDGLVKMAWGFFKKMVIADNVAVIVTLVYANPQKYSGVQLIAATVLFAFQIYCDFSGYSDIAIGTAKTLGFNLMQNFKHPYFSLSVRDFWRRWHISISSWFMDYVYFPLGGSRCGEIRTYANLMLTFLVSGLWHGAAWTFVIWGGLNGIYNVISRLLSKLFKDKFKTFSSNIFIKFLRILGTFILIDFSWIFFRATSLDDAFYIVRHLFSDFNMLLVSGYFTTALTNIGALSGTGFAAICCIVLMLVIEAWEGNGQLSDKIFKNNFVVRWVFYYGIILLILFYGNFGKSPFIYFDF